MPSDSRLLDLVVRWEEIHEAGGRIDVDELCRDCPELAPRLRERLQALGRLNAVLSSKETLPFDESASDSPPARPRKPADLPGYEILNELGRGGMGVVYRARQSKLNRVVALKVLIGGSYATTAARSRFQSEVEAVASLQHPHLIQVFEVGEHDGHTFFSMEYMSGGNLEDRIASKPQPARMAAELVATLAGAMDAAHERGVIHRDLKPANILLRAERDTLSLDGIPGFGTAKISDFGLAKRMDGPSGPTLTQHVLGTPSYMAPEQATGRSKHVGPATDIYGLGAILYWLLSGRAPFVGETTMQIIRQVTEDEPVPPRQLQPTVPSDLQTICLKCLQKQPAQRYSSAASLADDLHRFLTDEPILAKPVSWWERLAKWSRRRPSTAALIAVSALAFIGFFGGSLWFTRRLAVELRNARLAHEETVAVQDEFELALVRQVARALSEDFQQLEVTPRSLANILAQSDRYDEQQLESWTKALAEQEHRIHGIGVGFEPQQVVGDRPRAEYCLYAWESSGKLYTKQLLPPDFPPPFYRDRPWYSVPKETGRPWWSEPRISNRADEQPVLTYAVPILRGGKFCGTVSADLSISYFRALHDRLRRQYLGPDSYSFVITPGGIFVYHPNPRYEFPAEDCSLDRIHAPADFLQFVDSMREEDSGRAQATDFDTERPATFTFARILATGDYFVLVQLGPEAPTKAK